MSKIVKFFVIMLCFFILIITPTYNEFISESYTRIENDNSKIEIEEREQFDMILVVDHIVKINHRSPFIINKILQCLDENVENKYDKLLFLAIMKVESNFNPRARSKYAIGLMGINFVDKHQLIEMKQNMLIVKTIDLYDPCTNIKAGKYFLNMYKKLANDDLILALKYYNIGPKRAKKTKTIYPNKVLSTFGYYCYLATRNNSNLSKKRIAYLTSTTPEEYYKKLEQIVELEKKKKDLES